MKIDYNNRKFKPVSNSENSEISTDIVFHYKQIDNILTCQYEGANIRKGQLMGIVNEIGHIQMRYHQVNKNDELMTGVCNSIPEKMDNGKIRIHEAWQWTSKDGSKGESILEEV